MCSMKEGLQYGGECSVQKKHGVVQYASVTPSVQRRHTVFMDKGGTVEYSMEEGVQYGLVWRRHTFSMDEGVQYRSVITSVSMRVCSTNHSHFI